MVVDMVDPGLRVIGRTVTALCAMIKPVKGEGARYVADAPARPAVYPSAKALSSPLPDR